jgi:hypothetical protein
VDAWGAAVTGLSEKIVGKGRKSRHVLFCLLAVLFFMVPGAWGHVGSKDVFETVDAGPYRLFVTVRPPTVIPGVAEVEVRVSGAGAAALQITPLPLTGEASKHPPSADKMTVSKDDPAFFTGGVWLMATGSWQVRFEVDGAAGRQVASVAVPAVAISTLKMERGMGLALAALGLFLFVAMAGLVAAAVREARLAPTVAPDEERRRRGLSAMAIAVVVMGLMVWGGAKWWNVEAADYAGHVFRPLQSSAQLNGSVLDLMVTAIAPEPSRGSKGRSNQDFLADHGKLIHLYAIRQPEMDVALHLHPEMVAAGDFRMTLPPMPAGRYTLFGDVVHASGFPETLVTTLEVPAGTGVGALRADDALATPAPVSAGVMGTTYKLPDGYSMVWDAPASLTATTAYTFRFRLLGQDGRPASGMEPYLGMAGHAAFVKADGTVFAHTHPDGSAAMPAMDLANAGMGSMPMTVGAEVGFPYGFPTAGRYRIFVQMKHAGVVETGVFDAVVQ